MVVNSRIIIFFFDGPKKDRQQHLLRLPQHLQDRYLQLVLAIEQMAAIVQAVTDRGAVGNLDTAGSQTVTVHTDMDSAVDSVRTDFA